MGIHMHSSTCHRKGKRKVRAWSSLSLTLEVKFLVSLLRGFAVAALSTKTNKDRHQTVFHPSWQTQTNTSMILCLSCKVIDYVECAITVGWEKAKTRVLIVVMERIQRGIQKDPWCDGTDEQQKDLRPNKWKSCLIWLSESQSHTDRPGIVVFMKEVSAHTYTGICTLYTYMQHLSSPGHSRGSKEERALYDLTVDGFSA